MLVVLVALSATAADQSVLFVGNSYTSFNALHTIVADNVEADEVWSPTTFDAVTSGGYTLPRHLTDAETPGRALHAALVEGEMTLETVIFQDQSQIPGFPVDVPDKAASLAAVVELDALVAEAGAQTMLFQTWGRRDGDAMNPTIYPDYATMQTLLTDGYWAYHDAIEGTGRRAWIAPVGEAWRLVWDDVLAAGGVPSDPESDFHRLYARDGSHPSPYGSFLVAAVFHAALTGHDPQGNGVLEGTLDDERYRTYLETVAARAVLDSPYAFPLPWALDVADVSGTVSDPGLRLLVRVAAPAERAALSLGVEHDAEAGYGRLWVTDGAALEVTDLMVGAGGEGVLEVTGGVLDVVSASTRGSGSVVLSGGDTTVQSGVLPPVTQTGGTLSGAFEIEGDLAQSGGTLVATEGGRVVVAGAASIGGAIDVTGVRAEEQVVLTAASLVDDGFERMVRADQVVTVDTDAGTITVRSEGTATDTGSSATSTTTPGTSDDTATWAGDTGSTSTYTMDSAGNVCKEWCGGCGCSAGGATGGGWAIIFACAFGLRRRRHALA